jgi:hypothetical protein
MRDHRPRISAKVAPVALFLLPRLFAVPGANPLLFGRSDLTLTHSA